MNLSSNESLLLALLFTVLGFILLQYGTAQGFLLFGLSGLFLLFFVSFKIKAKDSIKLYSELDKAENYLQFKEIKSPNLKEGRMAALKEEVYGIQMDYNPLRFENRAYAYGAATYSDTTPIIYGNFVSCAKNFHKSIASRFAYEKNLVSGVCINESNPKKVLDMAAYIDFSSFLNYFTYSTISKKLKKSGLLNIVMCGKSDYAEFESFISTFSRKSGLCLLMFESQKLVFYDAET
ncbi:MAG: hypothetical protein QW814_02645 [Methanothrix sp.]